MKRDKKVTGRRKHRFLAAFLGATMMVNLIPISVFAQNEATEELTAEVTEDMLEEYETVSSDETIENAEVAQAIEEDAEPETETDPSVEMEEEPSEVVEEVQEEVREEILDAGTDLDDGEVIEEVALDPEISGPALATAVPTEAEAYARMIAYKNVYPEGTSWTNSRWYAWKGGVYSGGYGCAAFVFLLSDAAFGDLPARKITNVTLDKLHVGDILRINNDTHNVIVLQKTATGIVVAEGNYNRSVHWGRQFSAAQVAQANWMLTRYPEGNFDIKYTVTYDANGGSPAPASQVKVQNQTLQLSTNVPSRVGYEFKGWATSATATTAAYQAGGSYTANANATLYAVWGKAVYPTISNEYPQTLNAHVTSGGAKAIYEFAPNATGTYTFESNSAYDTQIRVYDEAGNQLLYNDDGGSAENFKLTFDLNAGEKRLVAFNCYSDARAGIMYVNISQVLPKKPASILSQPESVEAELGQQVSFSVEVEDAIDYSWQYQKKGSTKWNNSTLATACSSELTFTVSKTNCENKYRCSITGEDGSVTETQTVQVNLIESLTIVEQPVVSMAEVGERATFSVDADGAIAYQWQYRKKGGSSWYNSSATGAITNSISFNVTTTNRSNEYRCMMTSETGTVKYTNIVGFYDGPRVLSQPTDVTAQLGDQISFQVAADRVAEYQWIYSKNQSSWYKSSIASATTDTLIITVSTSNQANYYRCKITGTDGTVVYTDIVGIIVEE